MLSAEEREEGKTALSELARRSQFMKNPRYKASSFSNTAASGAARDGKLAEVNRWVTHTYALTYVRMDIGTYCTCVRMYMDTYVRMYCTYVHTWIHMYCTYVHTWIHTYVLYIHTYVHTYMDTLLLTTAHVWNTVY